MRILFILVILLTPPSPSPLTYVIPGASVWADVDCTNDGGMVTYHLTATDTHMNAYRLPGLADYPRVSLLMTREAQATLAGDLLSWQPHGVADEVWVIGGQRRGCLSAAPPIISLGRSAAPVVLAGD